MPTLPQPPFPTLPATQPPLPKPTLPPLPTVPAAPKVTLPPLPSLPTMPTAPQGYLASISEPALNPYNSNPFCNSIDSLLLPTTSYIEALSFFTMFLGVKACMYHY
ncbi:hypothetical protein OIU74_005528 [Salix koriyanagi]|uniref:Uncharacterized protein n=1 Tax=Salix koriyanagi TaxID=2511006 RepID=A0A9Q0UPF8_9ROSI|nr:hypothetical protein OIU74_005528 [Salix koriyanagi]